LTVVGNAEITGSLIARTSYGGGTGVFLFGGNFLSITNTDNNCSLNVTGSGNFSQGVYGSSLGSKAAGSIGFSPTSDATATKDAYFSRLSSGVIGMGSLGGSFSGSMKMANLTTTTSLLPPQYTTAQRSGIASPTDGSLIYNSTQTNLNTYNSGISGWEAVVDSDYVQNVSTVTQAQYNALSGGPVATTLYIITDAPSAGTSIANIASKTGNYTITSSDYCINVTASINTTITLPSAIGLAGYIFVIKNSGTGIVTVVPASGELIDGSSSMVIGTRYNSMTVMSLGTSTGYIIT
jgi:hypothetical protein